MAVSAATFKADIRFRAFANLDDADVASVLATAALEVDEKVWGNLADEGLKLLTAHKIAMSPDGERSNLRAGAGANQTSVFWSQYEDLRKRVGSAYRVVLDDPTPELL